MKFSIITTCYNRVETIRNAIESVLAQDYDDIEFIIVDGASSDGSLNIINEYKDRVDKIISEPDRGMYEAINKGLRVATGDVIGLLHSDDFYYDNHVVSMIADKIKESDADFVYGDGLFVDYDDTSKVIRNWVSGRYRPSKVRHGWLPLHPTCYIKRSVIDKYGLYDESYKIASDTDFLVRLLIGGDLKVEYLRKYFVKMRMGGLSTNGNRFVEIWREDKKVYKSFGLNPTITKIKKMMWKVPQYISALFHMDF